MVDLRFLIWGDIYACVYFYYSHIRVNVENTLNSVDVEAHK